jgi:hypothetical protein
MDQFTSPPPHAFRATLGLLLNAATADTDVASQIEATTVDKNDIAPPTSAEMQRAKGPQLYRFIAWGMALTLGFAGVVAAASAFMKWLKVAMCRWIDVDQKSKTISQRHFRATLRQIQDGRWQMTCHAINVGQANEAVTDARHLMNAIYGTKEEAETAVRRLARAMRYKVKSSTPEKHAGGDTWTTPHA